MPITYKGKITAISKLDSNGVATATYDIYKGTDLVGSGYSTYGTSKETIKDNIKEALRKYREQDKDIQGLNVGDEVTIGG